MPDETLAGLPFVTDPTRSQSENVETVVSRMASNRIVIPDYQRDADQWDLRKESLFVESLVNNLTIPAFFFAEQENGTIEVVDGQQRLSTIRNYRDNTFAISDDEDMVYLTPQSVHYRGKKYADLDPKLKNVFDDYPLTIIYLPKKIALNAKLEIFRRINEGGTPLSPQDIRLAYYSASPSVNFVRLAGLYGDSAAAQRMIASAATKGVENPWKAHAKTEALWREWWSGTIKAKGQTPSEMFLWYLVQRFRERIETLVTNADAMKHLPLSFRGTSEEVLDIVCAQLQHTDANGGAAVLPTYAAGLKKEFEHFVYLDRDDSGIRRSRTWRRQVQAEMALLIGTGVELKANPRSFLPSTGMPSRSSFARLEFPATSGWVAGSTQSRRAGGAVIRGRRPSAIGLSNCSGRSSLISKWRSQRTSLSATRTLPCSRRSGRKRSFRRNQNAERGGYVCPGCDHVFSGLAGYRKLHGDHKLPELSGWVDGLGEPPVALRTVQSR